MCERELGPLSPEQEALLTKHLELHPPPPIEPPKMSGVHARVNPSPETTQLVDRRIPTPDVVLFYKQLGWKAEEIAELFELTISQTRRLITAANREQLHETARDFIHKQFIPKALANIDRALDKDDEGRLSMELADKLGLLKPTTPEVKDEGSTATFEEYRMTVLRRRTNAPPAPTQALDAASVIDVSEAQPTAHETAGDSSSQPRREDDGPASD